MSGFKDLLGECVAEDGIEAVQSSLENITGPSNEQFFGEEVVNEMKNHMRNIDNVNQSR